MKTIYLFITMLLICPQLALAKPMTYSQHHSFLKNGVNFPHYRKCKLLLHKCPVDGRFPKASCTNRVLLNNKVCTQYQLLLRLLAMPASTVRLQKIANLVLLKISFPADGQDRYKLITPQGNVINTNIDPRKLDKALAIKYNGVSFLLVNERKPSYIRHHDGTQSVTVVFDVNNTCLACETIGVAKIQFRFHKDGTFQKPPKLISFSE